VKAMPKVELHRHLEGSLRLETLMEVARAEGLDFPRDEASFRQQVQITAGQAHDAANFLAKFRALRAFYRSPELIRRFVREALEDAARDGVVHLELRFTPYTLARVRGFDPGEVMDWVAEQAQQSAEHLGLSVALIVSFNRHDGLRAAERVVQGAVDRRGRGIAGLDLAGDEAGSPADPFVGLLRAARASGMSLTVHAGEWGGAENVLQAIEAIGAHRIGHGVRVLEDERAVRRSVERGVFYEVCPTSNLLSGVVPSLQEHPLVAMIQAGLRVTLNSDDPSICGITLGDEYRLAQQEMGLSLVSLQGLVMTAVQAAFVDGGRRKALERRLGEAFFGAPAKSGREG